MVNCSPKYIRKKFLLKIEGRKDWDNLVQATFEGKRRILDLLDVHGTLAAEKEERVLYI